MTFQNFNVCNTRFPQMFQIVKVLGCKGLVLRKSSIFHRLHHKTWNHYSDVIMTMMASQITSHHDCLRNRLFRRRSKKTSKLRVTGLCVGNSQGTGEFPAQRASNAENVSIWLRHHVSERKVFARCGTVSVWVKYLKFIDCKILFFDLTWK